MVIVCSANTTQYVMGWCDIIYSGIQQFGCINIDEAKYRYRRDSMFAEGKGILPTMLRLLVRLR